jgi:hypothetical protein
MTVLALGAILAMNKFVLAFAIFVLVIFLLVIL